MIPSISSGNYILLCCFSNPCLLRSVCGEVLLLLPERQGCQEGGKVRPNAPTLHRICGYRKVQRVPSIFVSAAAAIVLEYNRCRRLPRIMLLRD
jgi:hypothetical protein